MANALILGAGTEQESFHTPNGYPVAGGEIALLVRKGSQEIIMKSTVGLQECDDGSYSAVLAQGSAPEFALQAVQVALEEHRRLAFGSYDPRQLNQAVAQSLSQTAGPGIVRMATMLIRKEGLSVHRVGDLGQGRYQAGRFTPFAVPAEAPETTDFSHILEQREREDPSGPLGAATLRAHGIRLVPSSVPYDGTMINRLNVGGQNQLSMDGSRWQPGIGDGHIVANSHVGIVTKYHLGSQGVFQRLFDAHRTAGTMISALWNSYGKGDTARNRTVIVYRRTS